ncbi:glycoprotein-N-acetylgalactosamine 3-beta-galactosyltransferase 1-like isoform X1 [Neocloeon triangulifer]|uniref:glycoprotein-N-acetylgalactosamine 3-beta-galactosyltransferase 1-like isoform X1 n=1 Tax=Neocloeon triangulifer TaxID=2078957 RepID=UPI00286F6769|nr:glycoprotein-N-acetylgalactosamine 3-beta-galactosyltransferase 1-like isoform X1 [Neocloeon triangulifer]
MDAVFKPRRWTPSVAIVFALGLALGFAICQLKSVDFPSATRNLIRNEVAEKSLIQMSRDKELNSSLAKELLLRVEEMEARKMSEDVRVLCWVMTTPENHEEKAVHVKATWGRHCNKLIFISNEEDESLPALKLPGVFNSSLGRQGLWSKTVAAFKYVYQNCSGEYDWVMKADDDTYVIVENLRKMLLPYSPEDPIYFGSRFRRFTPDGFMSGGAGFVLSKEAVRRVVTEAFDGKHKDCKLSTYESEADDVLIAQCLYPVGVKIGESRDALGRNRFFPFDSEWHTHPHNKDSKDWWYWDYIWWPSDETVDNCSDEVISFHYMDKFKMYMMEYLVYHVRPFGVRHLQKYDLEAAKRITEKENAIKS